MAHRFGVLIPVIMICASSGQATDLLIEDFINSLHTTTLKPRSCGVSKECVPFYRCKAVDSDDSICGYPDTCCEVSDKIIPTYSIPPVEGTLQNESCGYRNVSSGITDNAEHGTDFGEFPWYASLMTGKEADPENYFCNAVIIAPTAVLTTAYCAEIASEVFFVRVGKWMGTEKKNVQHRARRVDKVISHENYDASSLSNNIALLITGSPFQWEENVRPVCLPESNTSFDESRCYLTNWTKDTPSRLGSRAILKRVDAPIVPLDQCLAIIQQNVPAGFQQTSTELCAGGKEGKDYDVFSNGTALVCPVPGVEDRYFLAGIVSHALEMRDVTNARYIPPKVPRSLSSIPLQLQWIKGQLRQNGIDLNHPT